MFRVACVIYNYRDRHVLTDTSHADGFPRFARKKWRCSPSTAVAWTLGNEDFVKSAPTVQDVKLRASYGIVGSQVISPYAAMGLISATVCNLEMTNNFVGYWANDIAASDFA